MICLKMKIYNDSYGQTIILKDGMRNANVKEEVIG